MIWTLLAGAALCSGAPVLHVDDDAITGGDGLTWQTAFVHLQDALAAAERSNVTAIHVAQGTYLPDLGAGQTADDPLSNFRLLDGVPLVGGFAGLGAGPGRS